MTTITNKNKEAINNNIIIEQDENEKQQESEFRNINSQNLDVKEKNNELKYKENEGNEFNKIIKKKQFKFEFPELEEDCCLDYDCCVFRCSQLSPLISTINNDCLYSEQEISKGSFLSRKKRGPYRKKTKNIDIKSNIKKKCAELLEDRPKRARGRPKKYLSMEVEESESNGSDSRCREEGTNIDMYNVVNFDEIILGQDIIEGNWEKDKNIELLIKEENIIYEKIKNFSENKGIKDENGIITLFILYYIYEKKKEKVEELKFVINKAKNFIKKIFNLDYDEIVKEI